MNKENILASRKDFRISKGNHILRVILLLLLLIILCLLTFLILIYTENCVIKFRWQPNRLAVI